MARTRTNPVATITPRTLTLDDVEALVAGRRRGHRPSELAFLREGARLLRVMSGSARGTFATLVCERSPDGLRIVEGCDALHVARELRARADWRGDHTWSMLMGNMVHFELVTRDAVAPRSSSRGTGGRRHVGSLKRVARGALAVAGA